MKSLALLAALTALLAGCNAPEPVTMLELRAMVPAAGLQVLAPPVRYASAGLAMEQAGRIDVVFVSEADARRICNGAGACTYIRFFGSCRVTMSSQYTGDFLAAMINHERAHCAGWPASHPP